MAVKDNEKDKDKPGTGAASKPASKSTSRTSSRTAGKAGAKKTAPSGGRRPAQTIDLKAEEVESKAKAESESKTKTKADSAKSSSVPNAGAKDDSAEEPADKKKSSARKTAKAKSTEPPQRTQPRELRGFVTHLAAGLVGGVIGVVGMGYGIGQMSPDPRGGAEQQAALSEEVTALGNKITTLETGIAALKEGAAAAEGSGVKPEALAALDARLAGAEKTLAAQNSARTALDERLAGAEKALAAQDSARAPLDERLAGLEKTLATLRESAAEGGDVAQTAAITARIDALASRLEERIKTLEAKPAGATAEDLATLGKETEARIGDAIAKIPAGVAREDIASLQADIEAQSKKLAELPKVEMPAIPEDLSARLASLEKALQRIETGEAEKARTARGAALAAAYAALNRATESGKPFAAELEAVGKLAPEGVSLDALAGHAKTGAPARFTLRQQFDGYRRAARETAQTPGADTSLVGRLLDNARSVVRVRRVGGADGDEKTAALSQMASLLEGGDLEGALKEAEKLPEDKKKPLIGWLDQAKARIELDMALKSVSEQLASVPAGTK